MPTEDQVNCEVLLHLLASNMGLQKRKTGKIMLTVFVCFYDNSSFSSFKINVIF